jgi:hypothetical protein
MDALVRGGSMNDGSMGTAAAAEARVAAPFPTFVQALRVWLRVGLLSFGGPAAQIAVMHREVVDERR